MLNSWKIEVLVNFVCVYLGCGAFEPQWYLHFTLDTPRLPRDRAALTKCCFSLQSPRQLHVDFLVLMKSATTCNVSASCCNCIDFLSARRNIFYKCRANGMQKIFTLCFTIGRHDYT